MKKIYPLLAAAVFAGGITTPVLAQDASHHKKATRSAYEHGSNIPEKDFKGEHVMSGTISKIDHSTGKLDLKTEEGTLVLHFPPDAMKNLKEGDQAAVSLEIAKQTASTVSKK